MKKIQLSDHFNCFTMLFFALPSIGMQIVDNTYQVADGYFISNFIGESAFAAENLIFPPLLIVMSIGLMLGSGTSAVLSKKIGENKQEAANHLLSMVAASLLTAGVIISVLLFILMPVISRLVGVSKDMIPGCVLYGRILAVFMPFQIMASFFHPLLILAEKPGLGLATSIANAITNIVLDFTFVGCFRLGMGGAAFATGIAWFISSLIPFAFFVNKRRPIHFESPFKDFAILGQAIYNGASELVDAVAYAIVALIFNFQMLHYLGDAGVDAYAVTEYVGGLFSAIFYGVSMSIIPVVGYHLGERNVKELKCLRRNGFILLGAFGIVMAGLCLLLANPISQLFVGYNAELKALSVQALQLTSLFFLIGGITTFSSSYFTGLNKGTPSLLIAVAKGVVGPILAVYTLPGLLGINGLWLSTFFAEVLALIVTVICFIYWTRPSQIFLNADDDPE